MSWLWDVGCAGMTVFAVTFQVGWYYKIYRWKYGPTISTTHTKMSCITSPNTVWLAQWHWVNKPETRTSPTKSVLTFWSSSQTSHHPKPTEWREGAAEICTSILIYFMYVRYWFWTRKDTFSILVTFISHNLINSVIVDGHDMLMEYLYMDVWMHAIISTKTCYFYVSASSQQVSHLV